MIKLKCPACGCEWEVESKDDLKFDKFGNIYCPCCGTPFKPDL